MGEPESTASDDRTPGRASSDPWLNWRAFHELEYRSSFDILAFTEWRLLRDHWDRRHDYDKDIARTFWERIQSCDPLKRLCARYSSKHFNISAGYPPGHSEAVERLHAVMYLFEWFHRREAGFGGRSRRDQAEQSTRKQRRREWETQWRGLKRAAAAVDRLPDLLMPETERERLLAIIRSAMEKAVQFAKNPPTPGATIVFGVESPDGIKDPGQEMRLIFPPNLNPDPPKRGRFRDTRSPEFASNLEVVLLDEFLAPMTKAHQRWRLLLSLLRHFNPTKFSPTLSSHALRTRVNKFRKECAEEPSQVFTDQKLFEMSKRKYLDIARHFMGIRRP